MNTAKALGERIRALRRAQEITQAELAERCGLSNNFIALLERGRNSPSLGTLERLSQALGVSIAELFETDRRTEGGMAQVRDKLVRKLSGIRRKRDLHLMTEIADFLGKH